MSYFMGWTYRLSGDWGSGNSAGGISGSPYHTRLISLDGSGGNQDRSLSAAAVAAPQGALLVMAAPTFVPVRLMSIRPQQ